MVIQGMTKLRMDLYLTTFRSVRMTSYVRYYSTAWCDSALPRLTSSGGMTIHTARPSRLEQWALRTFSELKDEQLTWCKSPPFCNLGHISIDLEVRPLIQVMPKGIIALRADDSPIGECQDGPPQRLNLTYNSREELYRHNSIEYLTRLSLKFYWINLV